MRKRTLEHLLAKQEITEVIYSYCRAMDRLDFDLASTVWHPDGTTIYEGAFDGTAAEFVAGMKKTHEEKFVNHSHQVSNILIEVDGDRATSESYVTATLRTQPEEEHGEYVVRGRYIDTWSQRGGRWAIDHRLFVFDMAEMRTIEPPYQTFGGLARRGEDDASYAAGFLPAHAS
jgi:SnoaL-like domain